MLTKINCLNFLIKKLQDIRNKNYNLIKKIQRDLPWNGNSPLIGHLSTRSLSQKRERPHFSLYFLSLSPHQVQVRMLFVSLFHACLSVKLFCLRCINRYTILYIKIKAMKLHQSRKSFCLYYHCFLQDPLLKTLANKKLP